MSLLPLLLLACTPEKDEGTQAVERVLGDEVDLIARVSPFIGTGGIGYGVGGSYPGAGRPFGLVKVSPDTADANNNAPGYSHTGGYHYDDDHIRGFSHMHMQGVGIAAYGALALMPSDGFSDEMVTARGHLQRFSHDDERAGAGWYEVDLAELDVQVALSATDHTALHRYTFGTGVSEPTVLVDLAHALGSGTVPGGSVSVDPDGGLVEGWLLMDGEMGSPYPLYFSIQFSAAPSAWGTWVDADVTAAGTAAEVVVPDKWTDGGGPPLGAWLTFAGTSEVYARVGTSNVDLEGARANLAAQHTGFDYDAERAAAEAAWAERLAPVRAWGGSERDQIIFATSLFKATQMPTLFSDVDGRYRGFDDQIHEADWGRYYTDFSLWDTYRTAHPLYLLLWPDDAADMMDSLAAMARDGGSIPRWPLANWDGGAMLGTPANIVFAEAYLKGVTDFDVDTLRAVALGIAEGTQEEVPYGGRPSVSVYDTYEYHPVEDVTGRSVAWTQELAISDHVQGLLEAALGNDAAADMLLERAGWWRNHYNPETGFFHARSMDGSFVEIENEAAWDEAYTEGNARQYRWLVPHDPEGLFAEMGGDDVAVQYLSELFEGRAEELEEFGEVGFPSSWYWHGNEPDIHAAWMFALAGRPDLTREWVGWVMDHEYSENPDGIDGNDDGGTLAAWFVFAASGLYPLNGTDRYVLGDPRFDRIELLVGGPDQPPLVIERLGPTDGKIVEICLNGEPLPEGTASLRHADLQPGTTLTFLAE